MIFLCTALGFLGHIDMLDKDTVLLVREYAVGMHHVLVGGELVLVDGEMTGRRPGRVIRAR